MRVYDGVQMELGSCSQITILLECGIYERFSEIRVERKITSFLSKYGRIDNNLTVDFVNLVLKRAESKLAPLTCLDLAYVSSLNRIVKKQIWTKLVPQLLNQDNEQIYLSNGSRTMMLGKVLLFLKYILLAKHSVRGYISESRVEELYKRTQFTFIQHYSNTQDRINKSKAQLKIQSALRSLSIPFIGEENVDFFDIDVYLPVSEIVLELYSMFHFYPYSRSFKAENTYFKEIIFREMGKKYIYLSEVPDEPSELQAHLLEMIG